MYIQTTYHPLKRVRAVGVSANLPELVSYKISVQAVLDHSHISIELLYMKIPEIMLRGLCLDHTLHSQK